MENKTFKNEKMSVMNERVSRLEMALLMLINHLRDPKYQFPELVLNNIEQLLINRKN